MRTSRGQTLNRKIGRSDDTEEEEEEEDERRKHVENAKVSDPRYAREQWTRCG